MCIRQSGETLLKVRLKPDTTVASIVAYDMYSAFD